MDGKNSKNESLAGAVQALENGGVIIHPTDTCYGLACSIFSQSALEKLYRLKKMPVTKPVSILVSSLAQAKKFGEWNETAKKLAAKFWPGPLTLILRLTEKVPVFLNPGTATIGIRFPAHALTMEIIRALGHPMTTTSANISGGKEAYEVSEIDENLRGKNLVGVDFLMDGGQIPRTLPSTIVDVSENYAKLVRTGPVRI